MDLIDNRTRAIGEMALDGLYERSKAISANTVNALTPNYQRKEVSFEKSLQDVIAKEDEKTQIKLQNSSLYKENPACVLEGQTPAQIAFMTSQPNEGFSIDVQTDYSDAVGLDGNNVNLEVEMMDEAQTGMRYQVVAGLLSKSYSSLKDIITGENS